MDRVVLFEDGQYTQLLPLTYWRSVCELRVGYYSLFEYALKALPSNDISVFCRPDLQAVAAERLKCRINDVSKNEGLFINARLLLTEPVMAGPVPAVQWLDGSPLIIQADRTLAEQLTPEVLLNPDQLTPLLKPLPSQEFIRQPRLIGYPWDLVHANAEMLQWCWAEQGQPAELHGHIYEGAHLLNRSAIHVGEEAVIKPGVVIDAEHGPIFIGKGVTISPNVSIEGPCYIGEGTLIQPGAVLRDAMSIGTRCKVGGELESSIIHGYSNKQHDGFLGHSYIGQWVNIAADTVNSDLKNTYGTIRVPINGVEVESNQIFMGLIMGDHSKTGIGQMFPTGTVVGFGCNIAICEFAPRFTPSFSWLTGRGMERYEIQRCLDVAKRVMARRQVTMSVAEQELFLKIPSQAAIVERPWSSDRR